MSLVNFGMLRAVLRQTILGMVRRLPTQWVMIASVAAMQSILAATILLAFNLDRLSEQWERGGDLLVFLKPGITQTRYEQLSSQLEALAQVKNLSLKTPKEALKELQESLGNDFLGDSFEEEVLPATIELEFVDDLDDPALVEFRANLLQRPEVDEVESVIEGRGLLAKLYEFRELIAFWRWIIGAWVGLSVMFVFSQFVRLNLHQRRREVEVLNSVGATRFFILSPLVIEGGLQACIGSITALWIVENILDSQKVGAEMLSELLLFSPEPLSLTLSLSFIALSTSLGVVASWRSAVYFLTHQE